jgi:hypothetical protein
MCGVAWHDLGMLAILQIVLRLLADLVALVLLTLRPRRSLEVENLVSGEFIV